MMGPRLLPGALLLLAVCVGCGGRGTFEIDMQWSSEELEGPLYLFVKVEERPTDPRIGENRILATAGPAEYEPSGTRLELPRVQNGERRVAIAELRRFPEPSAPVVAFGLSDWFSLAPGQHVVVPILVHATPTPTLADREGVFVLSPGQRGHVPSPAVDVVVIADARATRVKLSSGATFQPDEVQVMALEHPAADVRAPEGFAAWKVPWDLDWGRAPCAPEEVCPRDVFARAVNEYGYDSRTHSALVILDRRRPGLRPETSLLPDAAGPTTSVQLTLVADEVLVRSPQIVAPGAPTLRFRRILPQLDEPSSTFTYLSEPFGAERPLDGVYEVTTTLEDLAGNVTASVSVAHLALDAEEPRIHGLEVQPDRVGIGQEVHIGFFVAEDPEALDLRVTVAGAPVEGCEITGSGPARAQCTYRVSGDEAPGQQRVLAVLVTAVDRALNRTVLERPLIIDLAAPALADLDLAPSVAREGARVLLRVLASEPLGADPVLRWSPIDPGFTVDRGRGSPLERLFALTVTATTPEGAYRLEAVGLVDEVENRREVAAPPDTVLLIDRRPPVVAGLQVTPARVARIPGARIEAQFQVEEAHPAGCPVVTLGARDLSASCRESGAPPSVQWTCEHLVVGDEVSPETERALPLVVEVADRAGARATETALVVFDFLPPDVHGVELGPNPAKLGDRVLLRLFLTEPMAPGFVPQLAWSSGAPAFVHHAQAGSAFEAVWRLDVTPATAAGAHQLLGALLRDVAGNEAQAGAFPGLFPAVLQIDSVPPAISSLAVEVPSQPAATQPPRVRSGAGHRVIVRFTVTEADPAGGPRVMVGGRDVSSGCTATGALPSRVFACEYLTAAADAPADQETPVPVVVDMRDRAGNTATAGTTLIYDRRLPALAAVTLRPSPAGLGAQVELRVSASEALAAAPHLTWSNPSPGLVRDAAASTATEHVFRMTVGPSTPGRTHVLQSVGLTDLAGNTFTAQGSHGLPLSWLLDPTPPVVTLVSLSVGGVVAQGTPRIPRIQNTELVALVDVLEAHPAGAPSVRLSTAAGPVPLTCQTVAGGTGGAQRWRCRHLTTLAEAANGDERVETLTVEQQDTAGNRAAPVTASVVFDYRRPSLAGVSISPSPAARDALAVLRISASEPLAAPPVLGWTGPNPGFVHRPQLSTPTDHLFERVVDATLPVATYVLASVQLRDVAGNQETVQGASGLPLSWLADHAPPQLSLVSLTVAQGLPGIEPPRVPRIANRTVTLLADALEAHPAGPPEASIGSGSGAWPMACVQVAGGAGGAQRWRCTYQSTANEHPLGTEAVEPVTLQMRDQAGNSAVPLVSSLIFDHQPPDASAVIISPSPAGPGGSATLRITATEPIRPAPTLGWTGVNPAFVAQGSAVATEQLFSRSMAGLTSRTYVLSSLTLVDVAGNVATVTGRAGLPLSWLVDQVPPQIGALTVTIHYPVSPPVPRTRARAGAQIRATFTVTEANPAGAARVRLGTRDISTSCTATGNLPTRSYTCLYTPDGTEITGTPRERAEALSVEVEDVVGQRASDARVVMLDFEPPGLDPGAASAVYAGHSSNLLPDAELQAARDGTTVWVRLGFTEPLAATPQVTGFSGASNVTFTLDAQNGSIYTYRYVVPAVARPPDGTYQVRVAAEDQAGNTAQLTVPQMTFRIDATPPAAPGVNTPDLFTIHRAPWGAAETSGQPRTWLRVGAGGVTNGDWLRVLIPATGPTAPLGPEITRVRGAGAALELTLNITDRPTVAVQAVDGAGNASAAVEVRDGEWIVALTGRQPGSGFPNPHRLATSVQARGHLDQSPEGATELEPTAAEIDRVLRPDGQSLLVQAQPTWRQVDTTSLRPGDLPSGTSGHRAGYAVAYDGLRGRLVLFGGEVQSQVTADTWEWDGLNWQRIIPAGLTPPARRDAMMVYDAGRERILLFGGRAGTNGMNDTWAWDGATWQQVIGAPQPSPRVAAALAYDPGRDEVVLFGGTTATNQPIPDRLWILDRQGWRQVALPAPPASPPLALHHAAMAYVNTGSAEGLVLFGGHATPGTSSPTAETWLWNGATLTRRTPAAAPEPRGRHGMAHDPTTGAAMLFGGEQNNLDSFFSDVWRYNGTTWTRLVISADPGTPPSRPGRRAAALLYESTEDRFLVLAGPGAYGIPPDATRTHFWDVWAWNRTTWTRETGLQTSRTTPPARFRHAMASDDHGVVMFGGFGRPATLGGPTPTLGDTWLWTSEGWVQDTTPTAPNSGPLAARGEHAMAPERRSFLGNQALIMFGGAPLFNGAGVFGDTWRWARTLSTGLGQWSRVDQPGPSPRRGHAMASRPANLGMLDVALFGGLNVTTNAQNFWAWNGSVWFQVAVATCTPSATPSPGRSGHSMTLDSRRGTIVMTGGSHNTDPWRSWDHVGGCWTPRSPTPPTEVHANAAAIYDVDRGRSLVLGAPGTWDSLDAGAQSELLAWDESEIADVSPGRSGWTQPTARSGTRLAHDPATHRVVMFGGSDVNGARDDTWVISKGRDHRPSTLFTAELAPSAVPIAQVRTALLRVVAGATGQGASGALHGVILEGWSPRLSTWTSLVAPTTASAGVPAPFTANIGACDLERLEVEHQRRLHVRLRPRGRDQSPNPARLALDQLELSLRYRLGEVHCP